MRRDKSSLALVLLVGIISLTGCAAPASKDAVIAHDLPIKQHHQKTVSIQTQGGKETGAMDAPDISNKDLAKAIEESIIENRLFTQVIHGSNSDYLLSVNIVHMEKPLFGASFTVKMEAAWSLLERQTKKVVMRESIKSLHTTTMGEAFAGATRLRLAVEGAIRENIRQGLLGISDLQLN